MLCPVIKFTVHSYRKPIYYFGFQYGSIHRHDMNSKTEVLVFLNYTIHKDARKIRVSKH
jgi:hypothetical protein